MAEGEHEGHPPKISIALGQVGRGNHGNAHAAAGDAHAVLGPRLWLALDGHEDGLGEGRLHSPHLGIAQGLLVAAEGLPRGGVPENFTLTKDRVFLAGEHAVLRGEVHVDPITIRLHHQALDRRKADTTSWSMRPKVAPT
jgi:hypothetical protein